jgi:hypothetical protein
MNIPQGYTLDAIAWRGKFFREGFSEGAMPSWVWRPEFKVYQNSFKFFGWQIHHDLDKEYNENAEKDDEVRGALHKQDTTFVVVKMGII